MRSGLRGNLGSYFILVFLWSYGLANNEVAVPLFGSEKLNLSPTTIGYFFSVQGILSALMQSVLILLTLVFVVQIKGFFKSES